MKKRASLHRFFYPRSVAVVGTNRVEGTVPYDLFHNILKVYPGRIYPVSPREPSVCGVKAYKYVIDIEDEVDLAVIVFPSSVCHLAMEQCGQKGIRSVIIVSAGFRETGPAGADRERQVIEIAERYGISFIGPNCLGLINTDPKWTLNASFARKMPEPGSIAFLSQSGALCTAVLDYARAHCIGFSKFVSFGNKADVDEIEFLHYLEKDPATKVILLYLEEIRDGRALMERARELLGVYGKPLLILKSGTTAEGASAASLHTGSLAGNDAVFDAAFRQAGILRCRTMEELFDTAKGIACQPLPKGNRIAIITNAGGPGVLATDLAVREGLEMAHFTDKTGKALKAQLPVTASIANPVDLIGDARADRYIAALRTVLLDEHVNGAMVILTPQSMTDIDVIANGICNLATGSDKPRYVSFMGEEEVSSGIRILEQHPLPHFRSLQGMCRAFSQAFWIYRELHGKKSVFKAPAGVKAAAAKSLVEESRKAGKKFLSEETGTAILRAYGFPVLPCEIARSEREAGKIAEAIGFPVVMKVYMGDMYHRSDAGGVMVRIITVKEAENAYRTILSNVQRAVRNPVIEGVLIRRWIEEGEEVILGFKRDPSFGPVIMFGLGGLYVEVFRDVVFRVAPVDEDSLSRMIREIRAYPLLTGIRGKPERDIPCIEECIRRLSQLAVDCPGIQELDINPLIVHERGKGCTVADVKILLQNED